MESTEKTIHTQTSGGTGVLHIDPTLVNPRVVVMDWLKRHGATAKVRFAGSGDSGDVVSTEILVGGKELGLDRLGPEPEVILDAITALADFVLEDHPDEASVFNNEGGEVEIRLDPFGEAPDISGPGIIELSSRFLTWHDGETVRA